MNMAGNKALQMLGSKLGMTALKSMALAVAGRSDWV